MFTATLGGLIKDYRIRKRLSQAEVSLRIGWKDTSRLSKIEQGRVGKPTKKTIARIVEALEITDQERGEFLLTGGYLPSNEEIKKVITIVKRRIMEWPYPSYLIDFSWRCLLMNKKTVDVFGFPEMMVKNVTMSKPNLLEFAIAPKDIVPVDIFKGDNEDSLKPFLVAQIAQFKIEQNGRENDTWYKQLIAKLAQNNQFIKLWNEIKPTDYHKRLLDYEYKIVEWPDDKQRKYQFYIFTSRLIFDQRFQIVHYLPAIQSKK